MAGKFIDRVRLRVAAGDGGAGALSFRREKYVEFGGPDGGNGGKGGDIKLRADKGAKTLYDLSFRPLVESQRGLPGSKRLKTGRSGETVVLKVPVGTVVFRDGRAYADLVEHGQEVLVARGGRGGRGNASFKTNKLQAPRIAEKGAPGERAELRLELKLLADVGLVGFPNAGKSTFLARTTKAQPKIAGYPFTTLRPNLGLIGRGDDAFVLADIPGLIEGAHAGKGLGHAFLRHVERTRVLIHLVDPVMLTGKDVLADIRAIEAELKKFSSKLARKPRLLVVNKADLPGAAEAAALIRKKRKTAKVHLISAVTGEGVEALIDAVWRTLQAAPEAEPLKIDPGVVLDPVRRDKQGFEVVRTGAETYTLKGEGVERMVSMTNFSERDARQRLTRQFKKMGVDRAVRKAGVKDGDYLRIGDYELEWYYVEPDHDRPKPRRSKRRKKNIL